jgi:4-amino-4-deoxy-L-arabinose transferase-like glycosyltransferase
VTSTLSNPTIAVLVLCVLFFVCGVLWIDKPGIQTDEALFAAGIYPPFDQRYLLRIFQRDYPMMTMTYVGALKSRVWAAVFAFWPPSPASVRIPAVLLGALSVWLVYRLMSRAIGTRAALVSAALLSTDPIYILYSRWDHGPVVIQHLCLIAAMLAFVRFQQEHRVVWLGAGFFALGLGIWEKAIFAWLIGGLAIAALLLFWRHVRHAFSWRNCAVAMVAFSAGALPLIIFNARHQFITFRSNTVWSSDDLNAKVGVLLGTLRGDVLFGSMVRDWWDEPIRKPATAIEKAVVALSTTFKMPRRSAMLYVAFTSLLLIPLVWHTPARTAMLFVLICGSAVWLQMAFTKGAGGAGHHTILLWPLPTMGIAAVLACASEKIPFGRRLLMGVTAVACVSNLLVLSTYYTNLLRNGGTSSWTDAMYPAFDFISRTKRTGVCTVDWGFVDTVRLYEKGRTQLCLAADPVDEQGQRGALFQISQPGYIFLTHTEGQETYPGITARFVRFAEQNGFTRVNHHQFADTNGRLTVEIFQFRAF